MNTYVIITPARDEARTIRLTLDSVIRQTLLPTEWVIVDDGSSDDTAAIVGEYSRTFPWIHLIRRANRGQRLPGTGVMEAVSEGLQALQTNDWDYLVKLDADLSFAPDYFSNCLAHFSENPELGIGGGSVFVQHGNALLRDNADAPVFHVRGATKIYRKSCWQAINGLVSMSGWDTIDEMKANMQGWKTYSFPELKVIQHRETGGRDGHWRNAVKNGRANYFTGYHPVFMLLKCLRHLVCPSRLVNGMGLFWGYFSSLFRRHPRIDDPDLISFVRAEQWKRIFMQSGIYYQA